MPAERFTRMFRPEDMRLPDTWGKVDLATVPQEIRASIERNAPTPEVHDAEKAKVRIALYYANLAQMDDCAGQVLAALRELDLDKDTVVLYTSDHGEMLGEHGLWQKFVFYESSVGVPLLFRVPGLTPENARSATPVSLVQVFSTLTELCGVPTPSGLDGTSLAPCLREPSRTLNTQVFAEYNLRTPRAKYMLRRGDFKFNYYVNDIPELFNLREDPKEMRNLAGLPEHKGKVEEMKAQLFAWHQPPERG
jgi:choline-sulfatase